MGYNVLVEECVEDVEEYVNVSGGFNEFCLRFFAWCDDYDKSIPKIFVETYKAAYKRGYDAEHMAAQF